MISKACLLHVHVFSVKKNNNNNDNDNKNLKGAKKMTRKDLKALKTLLLRTDYFKNIVMSYFCNFNLRLPICFLKCNSNKQERDPTKKNYALNRNILHSVSSWKIWLANDNFTHV